MAFESQTKAGAISRKDSACSSRRTALPSKPVASNLVAIDRSRLEQAFLVKKWPIVRVRRKSVNECSR